MNQPMFDIFNGFDDKDALWVEAAEGIADALERMEQIAAELPGPYFVFSQSTHCILARIDTCKCVPFAPPNKAKSA